MAQQETRSANAGDVYKSGANDNAKSTAEEASAPNQRGAKHPAGTAPAKHASAASASSGKRTTRTVHAVPKSALTVRYEALRDKLFAFAGKTRAVFFGDTWAASALWLAAALACIALLLWFFFFSGYGAPAEPIYEGF